MKHQSKDKFVSKHYSVKYASLLQMVIIHGGKKSYGTGPTVLYHKTFYSCN